MTSSFNVFSIFCCEQTNNDELGSNRVSTLSSVFNSICAMKTNDLSKVLYIKIIKKKLVLIAFKIMPSHLNLVVKKYNQCLIMFNITITFNSKQSARHKN